MIKTRTLINLAVLGFCFSVLIACEATENLNPFDGAKVVVPAWPTVKLLQDADKVTVYRPGPGRDITDILYEAKLTGFTGECEYLGEDGIFQEVVVSVRAKFDLARGPADSRRIADLYYFVAVPEFFPAPEGKKQFERRVGFPKGRDNITFKDDFVEIRIPLTKDRKGPGSSVYIGFHLTQDQLKHNRRRGNASGLGG